jgi:hypothetical protein
VTSDSPLTLGAPERTYIISNMALEPITGQPRASDTVQLYIKYNDPDGEGIDVNFATLNRTTRQSIGHRQILAIPANSSATIRLSSESKS